MSLSARNQSATKMTAARTSQGAAPIETAYEAVGMVRLVGARSDCDLRNHATVQGHVRSLSNRHHMNASLVVRFADSIRGFGHQSFRYRRRSVRPNFQPLTHAACCALNAVTLCQGWAVESAHNSCGFGKHCAVPGRRGREYRT